MLMTVEDGWLFLPVLWQFLHDSRICMSLSYSMHRKIYIRSIVCDPGLSIPLTLGNTRNFPSSQDKLACLNRQGPCLICRVPVGSPVGSSQAIAPHSKIQVSYVLDTFHRNLPKLSDSTCCRIGMSNKTLAFLITFP